MPAGVLTQVGSALGGILLLILFVAWLVRRLGFAPQARNSKLLNVRASCQVGQRERVVIVEVDDTWLVLGVTAQQVTPCIHWRVRWLRHRDRRMAYDQQAMRKRLIFANC